MNLILESAKFAQQAHAGQNRKYGRGPYVHHPARVAARVALLPDATEEMVAAAFLHDVLEDTHASIGDLEQRFGPAVAGLVRELTNQSKGLPLPRAERKRMDREHLATISRPAKLIKLLDRIDNLREVGGASPDFRRLYTQESLLLAEAIGDADKGLKKELIDAAHQLLGQAVAP